MSMINSVLMILGLLLLAESCLVFLFPKNTLSVAKAVTKDQSKAKRVGLVELLFAVAFILIAINI